jgi:hypothetical protein
MSDDRSYVEKNARERERLRALVARLNDGELRSPVNEHWTGLVARRHLVRGDDVEVHVDVRPRPRYRYLESQIRLADGLSGDTCPPVP